MGGGNGRVRLIGGVDDRERVGVWRGISLHCACLGGDLDPNALLSASPLAWEQSAPAQGAPRAFAHSLGHWCLLFGTNQIDGLAIRGDRKS